MKKLIQLLFKRKRDEEKKNVYNKVETNLVERSSNHLKIQQEEIERNKKIQFNSKMSTYFQNSYKYSFQQLSDDLNMSPDKVLEIIKKDSRLSSFYNNILFSERTTAEELYQMLLNSIPPVFDTNEKFEIALENPAFNVVYSYYYLQNPTIDYYKLEFEKKLSNSEIQRLFQIYIDKSLVLKKGIQAQDELIKRRYENEILDNDYDEY